VSNVQEVMDAAVAKSAAYAAITVQLEYLHENRAFGSEDRQHDAHTTAALVQALAQLEFMGQPCCHHESGEPDLDGQ
jgi:hypothetical protein